MPEDSLEGKRSKKQGKKLHLNIDKKTIAIGVFLIISVLAMGFATRYLFNPTLDEWDISLGYFTIENGFLEAGVNSNNIAAHDSTIAYGTWEWEIRYSGSGYGSASIIFIGLDTNDSYYNLSRKGYKLQFELGKPVELLRIDNHNATTMIGSQNYQIEAGERYKVTITRLQNDTFYTYINNEFQFKATDGLYNTSEVFQIDWYRSHQLFWVTTKNLDGAISWYETFSNYPTNRSDSFFTKASLYIPFTTLVLIFLYYIFRILFSDGNIGRLIVPLLLAVIIGIGYGFIAERLLSRLDTEWDNAPPPSYSTPSPTGTDTPSSVITEPTPTPTNDSTPVSTPPPPHSPPFTRDLVSIILLSISGTFILIALVFVGIDFLKKREDEFHEKIIGKNKRWMPAAATTDHRKRVIRAYHKASFDLIDSGAKSARSMTPGEFKDDALGKIPVPEDSLGGLTDLYEEARFSEHEITSSYSEKAERYSDDISETLEKKKLSETKKAEEIDKEDADNTE